MRWWLWIHSPDAGLSLSKCSQCILFLWRLVWISVCPTLLWFRFLVWMLSRMQCLRYHSPYHFFANCSHIWRSHVCRNAGLWLHLPKEAIKTPNSVGTGKLPVRGSGGHPTFLQKCLFCAFDLSKRGNIFTAKFSSFFQQTESLFWMIIAREDQGMLALMDRTIMAVLPQWWFSEGLQSALHFVDMRNTADLSRTACTSWSCHWQTGSRDKEIAQLELNLQKTSVSNRVSRWIKQFSLRLLLQSLGKGQCRGSGTQSKVRPSYCSNLVLIRNFLFLSLNKRKKIP